jgi:heme/copper-type cytochrome/quinol oxidase subunit 2
MAQAEEKKNSRGMTLTFVILVGIAVLMYASFVYKIVKFGP